MKCRHSRSFRFVRSARVIHGRKLLARVAPSPRASWIMCAFGTGRLRRAGAGEDQSCGAIRQLEKRSLRDSISTEIRESSASVRSNPPEAPSDCKTNCKTGYGQFENYSHKIKQLAPKMVGVRGFEPPAPSSRTRCATRLRYTPPRRRIISPAILCFGSSYNGALARGQAR